MRLLLLYNGYVIIIIIIIIIACGLHNHTYIKPREVKLKIPGFINYHTLQLGITSYFTITNVFELQYFSIYRFPQFINFQGKDSTHL